MCILECLCVLLLNVFAFEICFVHANYKNCLKILNSDEIFDSIPEKTVKNPLVVILGIGDYDSDVFPSLEGIIQDYRNIKRCFNTFRGYSIVYQTAQRIIKYIPNRTDENDIPDNFKIRWSEAEIIDFNEHIAKTYLCDKKNKGNKNSKTNANTKAKNKSKNENINDDRRQHDGLIYFVSCHGGKDCVIYDSKGEEYSLTRLFYEFNNASCPYLRKMPKIYFLDCCRGMQKIKRQPDDKASQMIITQTKDENCDDMKDDEKKDIEENTVDTVTTTRGGLGNGKDASQQKTQTDGGICPTYIATRDDFKIFANTDGRATVDGGKKGGYLIRSVTQAFAKDYIFEKKFEEIRKYASRLMQKLMGHGVNMAVNVMECVTTVDYTIKFQEKK